MKRFLAIALGAVLSLSSVTVYANDFESRVVIEPQYDGARTFSEGLAAVKVGDKWGYIDEEGKMVIKPQYDRACGFNEGVAIVSTVGTVVHEYDGEIYESREEKLGFIDKSGNYTPLKYKDGNQFSLGENGYREGENFMFHNGFAFIHMDIFDRNGEAIEIKNSEYSRVSGTYNEGLIPIQEDYGNSYFYADKNGNRALEIKSGERYDNGNGSYIDNIYGFNQGLAPVSQYTYKDGDYVGGGWGFIDKSGKFVIEPKYSNFYMKGTNSIYQVFNEGIAVVQDSKTGLWGGIDKSGKEVISFKYEVLQCFNEGVAAAKLPGSDYYGFIDRDENYVIKSYDKLDTVDATRMNLVSIFYNGVAAAYDKTTDKAFAIKQNPNEGHDYTYDIKGSANLDKETYFPYGEDGDIYSPGGYMVINENDKYGYAENIINIGLPSPKAMDGWAYDEVVKSIDANLVPKSLQNQYRADIVREDFASLIVRAMEEISGKDIDELVEEKTGKSIDYHISNYPFIDTVDRHIVAANALGIIRGVGNGKFDSYSNITRQDAATLLQRAAKFLGKETSGSNGASFKDDGKIASYAKDGVAFVASLDIMKGTGADQFSPKSSYTRQQAYITVYRLLSTVGTEKKAKGASDSHSEMEYSAPLDMGMVSQ